MPDRRFTMKDLAAELGVSRSTVSNAFNRPDQLSDALRRRILDTARSRGYAGPDPRARTLRRGLTGAVGFLFDAELSYVFDDPAAVAMLKGVAEACQAAQVALVLVPQLDEESASDVVGSVLVDGFVVLCTALDDERRRIIRARHLPTVGLDTPVFDDEPFVGVDDCSAARELMGHVIARGHTRLGVVMLGHPAFPYEGELATDAELTDRYQVDYVSTWRLIGYREAVEDAGLRWDDVALYVTSTGIDNGRRAADHLLDRPDPPTAIVAMSDQCALGVLQVARHRGLDVPGQLAIAGFDDVPDAERAGLTTVRQPQALKGATAVDILLGQVPRQPRTTLPTELIVRSSTGGE